MAPRTQAERDAVTAESAYAFFSGLLLALPVLLAVMSPAWVLGLDGPVRQAFRCAALAAGGGVFAWRAAAILRRGHSTPGRCSGRS